MRIENSAAEAPADERLAACVWARLLDRMQSSRAPACSDAHLARVRNAIALGQFHVNARSLADRLIERLLQS
jgi:anti-sigma28 factor (negative regulator of flagellin synthesis)